MKYTNLVKELEKLYVDYINHGDSLKWFRNKKYELLEKHGYKTKEDRDKCLELIKKEVGIEHKIRPFL